MKTSTIIASLLIIVSQASFASQTNDPTKHNHHERPDMTVLAAQLELDDSQAQQLTDIMQQHQKAMKALRQAQQNARKDRHELHQQHREQLLTILDHKQLYELENYMQQFRPDRKAHKKD